MKTKQTSILISNSTIKALKIFLAKKEISKRFFFEKSILILIESKEFQKESIVSVSDKKLSKSTLSLNIDLYIYEKLISFKTQNKLKIKNIIYFIINNKDMFF